MTNKFVDKVYTFTEENALFSAPCRLLLATSGGADSMALLHIMQHWPDPDVQLTVVHVHHGLRGEYADRDEQFVQAYCEKHNIPFTVFHEDVAAYADTEGLSIEDAGRHIRYSRFEQCRQECEADYVLTAHTASDQAETVLMRLIRGTGVDGLVGIPVYRGNIRRPLLCLSREEIENYCREENIPYITDETNLDLQFTRNTIRHRVLPLLKEINPSVESALNRLAGNVAEDTAYFNDVCNNVLENRRVEDHLERSVLLNHPLPIRRRLIRRMLMNNGLSVIEEKHILAIEHVVESGAGSVYLPDGYSATVSAGALYLTEREPKIFTAETVALNNFPYEGEFGGHRFCVTIETNPNNVHNLFSNHFVDCDKIQGSLAIRSRLEGDSLRPADRGLSKTLKKLMNEWRIPAHLRNGLPILCDEMGIVLIPGYGCDQRVKPTSDTKRFLVWNDLDKQG